jgi:hypothetical protein
MLNKFILIGIGGSGGKTLRYAWRELERRLDNSDWKGGIPQAWQFLHIDVAELPDVLEGDVPADIGEHARYLGLAKQPLQYAGYDAHLVARGDLPALAGWRPDPELKIPEPWKGAGQRRAVGRVITLTQLDRVTEEIQKAVRALMDKAATKELAELNRALKITEVNTNAEPATAIVVSSLAGGSGSGAFLDVIEQLKTTATAEQEWLATSLVTILYAADVFESVPAGLRTGIEPNSLAALSELLSAVEHEGEREERDRTLVSAGGGTQPVRGNRAGRTNFIIGARNEQLTYSNSWDVFRAVGKSLATFLAVDAVQQPFQTYIGPNAPGLVAKPEFTIVDACDLARECSSFGYANVTLGRDLFAEYAQERLAKLAVERLLRGHRERFSNAVQLRDAAMIDEVVDSEHEWFFELCGLYERPPDHSQVLNELRDIATTKAKLDQIVADVMELLRADTSKLKHDLWLTKFKEMFDAKENVFTIAERSLRERNAVRWVHEIQARVLGATATATGRLGLPVTIALLERLNDEVQEAASTLDGRRDRFRKAAAEATLAAAGYFRSAGRKAITTRHICFPSAAQSRRDALQQSIEAELFDLAARLLRDLSERFVASLKVAIRSAQGSLAIAERHADSQLVGQWSPYSVPAHLLAAPNEILLDPEDAFPGTLDDLLVLEFAGTGREGASSAAVQEVITGAWTTLEDPGAYGQQRLIGRTSQWQPSVPEALAPGQVSCTAAFELDIRPKAVLAAASSWVRTRDGKVAEHVKGTLAEWLDGNKEHSAEHAHRFADAMKQVVGAAAPLVSINAATHNIVHGPEQPPVIVVSPIPIDASHEAHRSISETLRAAGMIESSVRGAFDATSRAGEVEISTFIGAAVHPVVFDSLTVPILKDWQALTSPAERQRFWQARRARQLPSFVPLSPSRQRALVRGWFTATLLGHVGVLDKPWSHAPMEIWSPRGPLQFPRHLLGKDVTHDSSVLPALMETMPLALLTYAAGNRRELGAYMRLLELGSVSGTVEPYDALNEELAAWIKSATLTVGDPSFAGAPRPRDDVAGTPEATAEMRRDAVLAALTAYDDDFRAIGDLRISAETSLTVPRLWEIRDLVVTSVLELAGAVRDIDVAPQRRARPFSVSVVD